MLANKKIGIQGIRGSFHHEVASAYFSSNAPLNEYLSFDSLAEGLKNEEITFAIMAIENSIAGSIIPNYALIDQYNLQITGEHYLSIHHNLMALKEQSINEIIEVRSHPMALLQCKQFFMHHPHIRLVETADTAQEAQRIAKNKTYGVAAIASLQAAELYSLSIVAPSIQTIQNNVTRFVVIQKGNSRILEEKINKACLLYTSDAADE